MSAAQVLARARAFGVKLSLDGDTLLLEAETAPPPTVVDQVARHKPGIVALLRPANDGWSGADWLAYFDERAGIAEFDGGLPRREAEALAYRCCIVVWLNRNPARSTPDHCLGCGGTERGQDKLLPFGMAPAEYAWLHSRCWPEWHRGRIAQATLALGAFGLPLCRPSGNRDWHDSG